MSHPCEYLNFGQGTKHPFRGLNIREWDEYREFFVPFVVFVFPEQRL